MTGFQNNFTDMFLLWPFTKIAKMVPFGWTKWPPELKKKGVDCHASVNNLLKRHLLLNRLMDFEIILQECFLSDPLPKLLKWCRFAKQNGIQNKEKKKKKKENLQTTSPHRPRAQFQNNFTEMFL